MSLRRTQSILEQIEALKDTYYHIDTGYTTRDIIRELELVKEEEWVRKNFPELYKEAEFDEQDQDEDSEIVIEGCEDKDEWFSEFDDLLIPKRAALMNTYYEGKNFTSRQIIEKLNLVRDEEWVRKNFDDVHQEADEDSENEK